MVDFLESHSRAIQDRKHVVKHHIAKCEYVEHTNHIVEMKKVALFA